ncbi:MAG: hypothetical protein ACE5EC_01495, partial [Phycisphaerae bacterium]
SASRLGTWESRLFKLQRRISGELDQPVSDLAAFETEEAHPIDSSTQAASVDGAALQHQAERLQDFLKDADSGARELATLTAETGLRMGKSPPAHPAARRKGRAARPGRTRSNRKKIAQTKRSAISQKKGRF